MSRPDFHRSRMVSSYRTCKVLLLNYGLAKKYNGKFNLRFDDTNPTKEKTEFVESIKEDVAWLGADWEDRLFFASDYFETMYECAVKLIKKGKAFVCDLTAEQIREYRGTLTEPGKNSPYRDRSVEENLELFENMKNGVYQDGEKCPQGEDRYGVAQYQYAGSGHLPGGSYESSQYRRCLVHLSHV